MNYFSCKTFRRERGKLVIDEVRVSPAMCFNRSQCNILVDQCIGCEEWENRVEDEDYVICDTCGEIFIQHNNSRCPFCRLKQERRKC